MSRPRWSKSNSYAPIMPEGPCAIELYAYSLGLKREEWAKSSELKAWARKNVRACYVPSDLVEIWGLFSE